MQVFPLPPQPTPPPAEVLLPPSSGTPTAEAQPLPVLDAVAMTGEALAQASELRTQMLLAKVTQLIHQLQGELLRVTGESPFGKAPADLASLLPLPQGQEANVITLRPGLNVPAELLQTNPNPTTAPTGDASPQATSQTQQIQELTTRAIELVARLAKVAPKAAEALLAQHQVMQTAFPEATAHSLNQLGNQVEPELARFLRHLLQPQSSTPPETVPKSLAQVFTDPAQMTTLLKRSAKIADLTNAGGSLKIPPTQGRVTVPPARSAMDGVISGVGSPRLSGTPMPLSTSPFAPVANIAESLLASSVNTQVNATLDTVTLSGGQSASRASVGVQVDMASLLTTNQGSLSQQVGVSVNVDVASAGTQQLGVGVMVNVNQILSQALGEQNPLALSQQQIEIGVQVLQGAALSPSLAPMIPPMDRLAGDFATMLVDLRQTQPEAFNQLMGMLKALAQLNPGKFDSFLSRVESQLRGIVDMQRAMQGPANQQAAPPAGAQAHPAVAHAAAGQQALAGQAAPAAGGPQAGGTISVVIDVDINQRTDMLVQQLRDQGIDARALQSQTQIEINVQIGMDGQVQKGDPLIIDLQGDGVEMTDRSQSFDIDGDGDLDRSAFVKGDDALLMLDTDGNGRLTDGKELFGDQEGDADGFTKLARYDDNADGKIDAKDSVFDQLKVVFDKNGDGVTGLDEIASLKEVNIESISLVREATGFIDQHGNELVEKSEVKRTDGTTTAAHEAIFTYQD